LFVCLFVVYSQSCKSIIKREAVRADHAHSLLSYGPITVSDRPPPTNGQSTPILRFLHVYTNTENFENDVFPFVFSKSVCSHNTVFKYLCLHGTAKVSGNENSMYARSVGGAVTNTTEEEDGKPAHKGCPKTEVDSLP